jgi:YgiT-type zinc finger domain-containing protein
MKRKLSMNLAIAECPTCGSTRIRRVRRNWRDTFQGETYVVPNLEFEECPDCGERLYDRDAMRKIEAHSPAYAKRRAAEKKAAAR